MSKTHLAVTRKIKPVGKDRRVCFKTGNGAAALGKTLSEHRLEEPA
jgi:hypothetical protein